VFGVDSSELIIVAIVALIFIGPKELPTAMRTVGRLVGRVRAHARHFTSGIENMMREAELEEMEKKWREENERIMTLHPANPVNNADPYAGADAMPPVVDAAAVAGMGANDASGIDPDVPVEQQVMLPLGLPAAPDDTHLHLPPAERPLP
jgi:sec-independent protein translocase protein TatB